LLILLLFSLFTVSCSQGSDSSTPTVVLEPPPAQRDAVPIAMPVRSTGRSLKLLGLPVTVAGSSSELLLDTGSAGIRILSSAVGSQGLLRSTIPSSVTFADGTQFIGVLATAPVSVGSIATEAPITIQLIDTCEGTSCDIISGTFSGLIGTSLSNRSTNPDLYSPLSRLPGNLDSGYLISTGGFNSVQGIFTLGLTPANTAGFSSLTLPARGTFNDGTTIWDDAALEVSYTITDPAGVPVVSNVLSSTVFDTGSSDTFLSLSALGGGSLSSPLPPGSIFRAALSGGFDYQSTVGTPPTPGCDRVFVNASGDSQLIGMPLFFQLDTLFDSDQGRIGFRIPNPQPPSSC
jgi:hypothetical protein